LRTTVTDHHGFPGEDAMPARSRLAAILLASGGLSAAGRSAFTQDKVNPPSAKATSAEPWIYA
jgi:hypothetical protein